jgi:hypothetical protein
MNNSFRTYDEAVVLIEEFGRWFIPWKGGRAAGTRALERWRGEETLRGPVGVNEGECKGPEKHNSDLVKKAMRGQG